MAPTDLNTQLTDIVERHPVPGAALGIWHEGGVRFAFHGYTNVENPLPVNSRTRFQIGSISKTYAVTAVMRLVSDGVVTLDDPVRQHVPELRLADQAALETLVVRDLLNHTAGWDGSMTSGCRDIDAPLKEFVHCINELEQLDPPGARVAYNNSGVALAGRLLENVTGQDYEDAIRSLLLEPIGLNRTGFTTDDLVAERCTVGHRENDDGNFHVARPWRWPRAANPEGGLVSSLGDQLAWAAFHLGDGTTEDGSRLINGSHLAAMRRPTKCLVGSSLGDAVGLGWFRTEIDGTLVASHPGSTNGQHAELLLVPEHRFAVAVATNGAPSGMRFLREATNAVLADHLGLHRPRPQLRPYNTDRDGDVAGVFASSLLRLEVSVDDDGELHMSLALRSGDEIVASDGIESCRLGVLSGDRGEFLVLDGALEGLMGAFLRDANGTVTELSLDTRLHQRAV